MLVHQAELILLSACPGLHGHCLVVMCRPTQHMLLLLQEWLLLLRLLLV